MGSFYLSFSSQQRAIEHCILNTLNQWKHFIEKLSSFIDKDTEIKYKETYYHLHFHQNMDMYVYFTFLIMFLIYYNHCEWTVQN